MKAFSTPGKKWPWGEEYKFNQIDQTVIQDLIENIHNSKTYQHCKNQQ